MVVIDHGELGGIKRKDMITKFKIFEAISLDYPLPLFKVGDTVYYHGRLRKHHGYYKVKERYHSSLFQQSELEKGDTGWRYDLSEDGVHIFIRGSWEMSSSPTEEEGKRKDKEYQDKKEELRKLHMDFDPYGEEVWESIRQDDPYGEEIWENEEVFKIGDKVICMNTENAIGVTLHKKYIVSNPNPQIFNNNCVEIINDFDKKGIYINSRFRKVLNENVNILDPYGEEDWEDKNKASEFDIFDDDDREENLYHRVGECRLCGRYAPHGLMLDDVCPACRFEDDHCYMCGSYVPHEFLHDGACDLCLKDPTWNM